MLVLIIKERRDGKFVAHTALDALAEGIVPLSFLLGCPRVGAVMTEHSCCVDRGQEVYPLELGKGKQQASLY